MESWWGENWRRIRNENNYNSKNNCPSKLKMNHKLIWERFKPSAFIFKCFKKWKKKYNRNLVFLFCKSIITRWKPEVDATLLLILNVLNEKSYLTSVFWKELFLLFCYEKSYLTFLLFCTNYINLSAMSLYYHTIHFVNYVKIFSLNFCF